MYPTAPEARAEARSKPSVFGMNPKIYSCGEPGRWHITSRGAGPNKLPK